MAELIIAQNLRDYDIVMKLLSEPGEMRNFLQSDQGREIIESNLKSNNFWRRLTPPDTFSAKNLREFLEYFRTNYITVELPRYHKNWIEILLKYRDYLTLENIVKNKQLSPQEIRKIRKNFASYPVDQFISIWKEIGEVQDFLTVVRNEHFGVLDIEKRLFPLVDFISDEDVDIIRDLLRETLTRAPNLFRKLFGKYPDIGKEVLEEEIVISDNTKLETLRNIGASLFEIVPRERVKKFAISLLNERMKEGYNRESREVAWSFSKFYLEKEDIQNLKKLENSDNRLWLRSKLQPLAY